MASAVRHISLRCSISTSPVFAQRRSVSLTLFTCSGRGAGRRAVHACPLLCMHAMVFREDQGIARTQSPTNKNYAPELPTFGAIDGVSPTGVQWKGLVHGEPPYGSRYPLCQVSMLWHGPASGRLCPLRATGREALHSHSAGHLSPQSGGPRPSGSRRPTQCLPVSFSGLSTERRPSGLSPVAAEAPALGRAVQPVCRAGGREPGVRLLRKDQRK